jgi:hypothetical protein
MDRQINGQLDIQTDGRKRRQKTGTDKLGNGRKTYKHKENQTKQRQTDVRIDRQTIREKSRQTKEQTDK